MQIDLIMQLTLKLSKCGICADAVDLSKILTRYDVAISHIGSPKWHFVFVADDFWKTSWLKETLLKISSFSFYRNVFNITIMFSTVCNDYTL